MGHVPSTWKEAAVVPIHKGGDRSLAKNYWPISLTSPIMKVLERIIRKELVDFLSDYNYFNPNQHGFRHGRSCLSALLDVYDNMMTSLSNNPKSSVDMIYLDYAKAFDKVDHRVVLNKLKYLGICGKLGKWLHSFLTNRRQQVRIPGGVSKSNNVLSGLDCDNLQSDLDNIYLWSSENNMMFNQD